MRGKRDGFSFFIVFFIFTFLASGMPFSMTSAYADETKRDLPPRAISVSPEYTGIVVPQGEKVSVDIIIANRGRSSESVALSIPTVPKGWKAWIETYSNEVTGVFLESDDRKTLSLKAEADKTVGPGKYTFKVQGQTLDGQLTSSGQLKVILKEKDAVKKSIGVNITTSYPVLQGPTDSSFEFSLDVESEADKDAIFNLNAQGPKDWVINFKPAYEDKYISSLRIKSKQSQSMAIQVKPYALAEPGRYPIKVLVSSEKVKGEVDLVVVLTGTFRLEAGTATGLLSLNAFQGKEANFSFYIRNTGSAPQNNIRFLTFKPENWKVTFKPEKIETLAPDKIEQVEMTILPADQALVGDYSVALKVEGEKASKDMELRVTVKASTAWGWVGIGIIILVIIGMVFLFIRMGRR